MTELEKKGFELIWQIRHLLINPGIDREASSCTFITKGLHGSEWIFSVRNERLKLMATLEYKNASVFVSLKCNAFVLLVGKSPVPLSEENSVDHVFSFNSTYGTPSLELKVHDDCSLLFQMRNELLYCESLTVCCQLIPLKAYFAQPIIYFALSNSNRICKGFPVVVNNFSSLDQDHVYEIKKDGYFFTTDLSITVYKNMSIRITLIDNSEKNLILLDNIFLMDVNGMATKIWDKSVIIMKSSVVPLNSVRSQLKEKSKFLSNDRLTLQFQISIINLREKAMNVGEVEGMTSAQYQDNIAEFFEKYPTEILQSPSTEDAIQRNTSNSLNNDMQNIFSEGTLVDFELRFPADSIQVHKAVLCARSSVFKAMLSTDMKESSCNWVDIGEDMDAATMHSLVKFMYSDTVPSLDWDSTAKLYAAADKYDVPQLKQGCSKFFSSNLSVKNVCSLLCLADKHSDNDLKSAINNIIFEHDETVMDSHEWNLLMKENSKLALETMFSLYQRKVKP